MRTHQEQNVRRPAARRPMRRASIAVESLEARALLSGGGHSLPGAPALHAGYGSGGGYGGGTGTGTGGSGGGIPISVPNVPSPTPTSTTPGTPVLTPGASPTLSQPGPGVTPPPAKPPLGGPRVAHGHSGEVTKTPRFYELYTGPRLPELNAVKASGKLAHNGTFTFTGTNKGRIDQGPAVYVWGIDRSGQLSSGPFPNRPGVTFDAVVIVSFDSSLRPTAQVMDFVSGATTNLSPSSVHVHGRTISVTVPESALPSTGLPPSQYRFNYWPADNNSGSPSSIASFAPEFTTVQVGTVK